MFPIKLCLDLTPFTAKPTNNDIMSISKRIGGCCQQINTIAELQSVIKKISEQGHTFCPATFKNGTRRKDNFEQQQIIALDFDNSDPNRSVSIDEVCFRARKYNLGIVAAYETFSSENNNRFRIFFINDAPINDAQVIEAMQLVLGTIFHEADPSCIKDISKMYFGGKREIFLNEDIPTINIESVFRALTYYLEDQYKNHYREKIMKFSDMTGIALNDKGLIDVLTSDEPFDTAHLTEKENGALTSKSQNGNFSPNTIYYYIIANGENFPKYYRIGFYDCTKHFSVANIDKGNICDDKDIKIPQISKNHKHFRSDILSDMSYQCRLYHDFTTGDRKLSHDELFHLQLNMRNIESGDTKFLSILCKYPNLYPPEKVEEWKRHCKYNKQYNYRPSSCSKSGCPYREKCSHGKNILTTVHPKRGEIEKDLSFKEEYYSLGEAEQSMRIAIDKALRAENEKSHIIFAPCAIGKSTAALDMLKERGIKFSYAVPTIRLEDQIYNNALALGLDVCKTPSLQQLAYALPDDVRVQISIYYLKGQANLVHPYLEKVTANRNIPCLTEYMKERTRVQRSKGNLITTHRYLMNMDSRWLNTYNLNIIDEDLICKSYITNQCSIPISKLREEMSKLLHFPLLKQQDKQLLGKIDKILERCKTQSYIKMDSFQWKVPTQPDDLIEDKFIVEPYFDKAAFCMAEHFYVRHATEDKNIKEDTVVFIKPFTLKKANYVMLSATASEKICQQFFGSDNMVFHDCKQVKYRGNLYQFPGRSMSRSSIADDEGVVEGIVKAMEFKNQNIITFANQGIGEIHFGNTDGLNSMEGKDLLVVGTPYHPEFLYKLVAHNLGFPFNENEKMSSQYISHNGYKTWFTTFKDENLRAVHFWMIESELEQAVGRARLPRYDCNVYVFSNFPLRQAQMRNFDYRKLRPVRSQG